MADGTTTNYALTKPQVGASRDSWGDKMNANMDAIDTGLKAAKTKADAAVPQAAGAGGYLHFGASALTGGVTTLAPATGTDPTVNPGDLWLGY